MQVFVFNLLALVLFLALFLPGANAENPGPFLDEADITWKVNEHQVARWKTLVGGNEGGQIDRDDIQFGTWQLAPGAVYHRHRHEVPEIYYITQGRAIWTVGDDTREVGPGTTVYTKPHAVHRMENPGNEPVHAIWIWWAPNGDTEVFSGEYEFTEPAPPLPNGSGFKEGTSERLY